MAKKSVVRSDPHDPELESIAKVYSALSVLDADARGRVLEYVAKRLALDFDAGASPSRSSTEAEAPENHLDQPERPARAAVAAKAVEEEDDGLEGISPVAQKWMRRNQLTS